MPDDSNIDYFKIKSLLFYFGTTSLYCNFAQLYFQDGNMPSGEAFIRQFLLGQRFFQEEFGIKCKEVCLNIICNIKF